MPGRRVMGLLALGSAMSDVQTLLLGVALGAIPTATLGQLMLAWLGKRLGVQPKDIQAYEQAAEDGDDA